MLSAGALTHDFCCSRRRGCLTWTATHDRRASRHTDGLLSRSSSIPIYLSIGSSDRIVCVPRSHGMWLLPRLRHKKAPAGGVCVEFQLTRRQGAEIVHCNAVATGRSRRTRAVGRVRRCAAPVSPLSVRCDSDIGCRTPCSPRACVRGRSGSKTRSDPDTRAGWFRSAARRKHANGALREWSCSYRLRVSEGSLASDESETADHGP